MTAATIAPPMLEVVSARFLAPNGAAILDDVSLRAMTGDILAVVGPNGAGKTTLIRLLAGLTKPHRGEVRIDGQPLQRMPLAERARTIAYVGQSDEPDGRLTVGQYVALGLSPASPRLSEKAARLSVDGVLSLVGLTELADRRMDRVSGGERQKAKIARAMCQRPKLLVLDEPTNHLDPHARGALLRLLSTMKVTVVAALHDLTLIDAFADKVAMVENGRLVAFADPQEALSRERVRDVFHVELYRFPNPNGGQAIAALDVMNGATPSSTYTH